MTNLTCFWHPVIGVFDLDLDDPCDTCGQPMNYPLNHLPKALDGELLKYEITAALDRGYYGATYIAKKRDIGNLYCIKLIPKKIYQLRDKDFVSECAVHAQVAQGTEHLVGYVNHFDSTVEFGDQPSLDCHVAVLEYVDGISLRSFIDNPQSISVTTVAQIALDMMNLLAEIETRRIYHNDLHSGNILVQQLKRERERSAATIDPAIRLVAVDLGSVTDYSRSTDIAHMADAHHITEHLTRLIEKFEPNPESATPMEYRMGLTLSEVAAMLRSGRVENRSSYKDLADKIIDGALTASAPWHQPHKHLSRFTDSYNAQTMIASFIPKLLVDPSGQWQKEIASPGPLLVTGMRGCGKTMLLRSCQFHARAHNDAPPDEIEKRLRNDSYVGLYVSCQRLLDPLGRKRDDDGSLHEPHARLFLRYAREALQALLHLRHISPNLCTPLAPRPIASLIMERIGDSDVAIDDSIDRLDRKIERMLRSLEGGDSKYSLSAHPAQVMPDLANAIRQCSPVWTDSEVLYLLDDVSTRHLNEDSIRDLVSSLMFNEQNCAFKMTTETQTFELVLKSPGLIEQAQQGRDYRTFDLAAEINESLRHRSGSDPRRFIANVLARRARLWLPHPDKFTPEQILGQCPLRAIGESIASKDKAPYHGIQALGAVCVGDIGDVITIYESIVRDILRRDGSVTSVPAPKKTQTEAFLLASSKRKYYLSGRDGRLTSFAEGFAEAAHKLLVDSVKKNPQRIRDYGRIHVRISSGDIERQLEQLRQLVDAGVFVLAGGPEGPRVKSPTAVPHNQMILIYRKLLGLGQSIGLGQRDRFELEGQVLEDWLANPEQTTEILLRNLALSTDQTDTSEDPYAEEDEEDEEEVADVPSQFTLFSLSDDHVEHKPAPMDNTLRLPTVNEIQLTDLAALSPGTLVGALGFEERCLTSVDRLLQNCTPNVMMAARYPLPGHTDQIVNRLERAGVGLEICDSGSLGPPDLPPHSGIGLVDVTGLSKALIYRFVRALLLRDGEVLVSYTSARDYYPLDEEVRKKLAASKGSDDFARLQLFSDILTGEGSDYDFHRLEGAQPDDGRLRALMASSSPKHRRLGCFLEERAFDQVGIIVPAEKQPRDELALLAARVATDFHQRPKLIPVKGGDVQGMLSAISKTYWSWFHLENYSFEVGLTGSKISAIAFSVASTVMKFTEVWHVAPQEYDTDRFTVGSGQTRVFHIVSPQ